MFVSRRISFLQFVVLAVLVALTSSPAVAQTVTGTMNGTVTDRSGGLLPGVTVTIRNNETGLQRIVTTNKDGYFTAPYLPVAKYDVQAELAGFGAMRHRNVGVDLNQTVVQDFILDPAMTETVTVAADAPRINVTDGEIKQTMRSEEIMSIPIPDQTSFLKLASTFAGYMENPTSGQDNPTASSGSSVNFNGAGTRGATFQINGVNNDDSSENQHRQGVAIATIKSFQVLSNNYSSEFGRGYGAVVLVQTKSGTNSLEGEVYGYAQNNDYISRDVLAVSLTHGVGYRRQFGATAGFPIIRDRLFGYLNTDQTQLKRDVTATRGIFTAADLAMPRLTLGNDTPANRAWQQKILGYWPDVHTPNATNLASRAYQYLQNTNFPDRDASARIDAQANQSNTFSARYQRTHQIRQSSEFIVGEQAVQNNRQSNFGLTYTGILTPTTVQEARVGIGLRATNVNISAGNDTPVVRINGTGVPGSFTILGNAGSFPITRNQRDDQFVYNISSAHWAKHTLKLGTDLRRGHLNDRSDNNNRGVWQFNAACGGVTYPSGLEAFMAGCVGSYTISYGPNYLENKLQEANVYAQDDWRPIDSLTLNLGLRYERVNAPKEEQNRIDYLYKTSHYIDPRLGFAYTPNWDRNRFLRALTGGNGMFSIRGGYGTFHGRVFQSVFSQNGANVRYNPPNAVALTFTNPFPTQFNVSDPTGGFVFVPGQPLTTRVGLTTIDPGLKMPETHQFNLTFERQVFWQSRLRLSYIGLRGVGLLQYRFDNLPVKASDPNSKFKVAVDWRCAGTGNPGVATNATCPVAVPIADNEISLRVPRTNDRRPDSRYTTNLVVNNGAKSWYNAGQLEWETGVHAGFLGRMTYTYSKATDEGSEATFVGTGDVNIFPEDPNVKRGLSRFDTRHRFTLSGTYMLPWLQDRRDWVGLAFGGWQLASVIRLSSGTPFTITDGGAVDFDFDGVTVSRPVVVDPAYRGGLHINYPKGSQAKLPKSAFRHAVYGDTSADLIGRNTFYTDGQENIDVGLYKTFGLPASLALMVRLDAFNVFNHPTWSFPVTDFNAANFGVINATNYSPRTLQLGFRFLY